MEIKEVMVKISDIEEKNLNPRSELSIKNIEMLMEVEQLPPIHIGTFEDKLYLIDGYHRKEVAIRKEKKEIEAYIHEYKSIEEMLVKAFLLNVNHGKRLEDIDVMKGIIKTYEHYKENNVSRTYEELGKDLGMNKRMVNSYIRWGKVMRVLQDNTISKSKSDVLARFDLEKEGEKILTFWNKYNKLSVHDLRIAHGLFLEGKDFYKVQLDIEKKQLVNDQENKIAKEVIGNVLSAEEEVDKIKELTASNTKKIDALTILKRALSTLKGIRESYESLNEGDQLDFSKCKSYGNYITKIKKESEILESLTDDGWINYNTEKKKNEV